jgi:uncharacterized membrane protein YoaK (UPF0700 family)
MGKFFDLKQKITWTAWQFGVLKMYSFAIGIICGAYFANFFTRYYVPLWIIAAITWSFSVAFWMRATEQRASGQK